MFSLPSFLFLFQRRKEVKAFSVATDSFRPPLVTSGLSALHINVVFAVELFNRRSAVDVFRHHVFYTFVSFQSGLC